MYRWEDGKFEDDEPEDVALRVFVFDTAVDGTTEFELRMAPNAPPRGGLLSSFSRNRPVADLLTWPLGTKFHAYFASRPGTTLCVCLNVVWAALLWLFTLQPAFVVLIVAVVQLHRLLLPHPVAVHHHHVPVSRSRVDAALYVFGI